MANKIEVTQTPAGRVYGFENDPGFKVSDGSALLTFSRSTTLAQGPEDAKSTFMLFDSAPGTSGAEKNMLIQGAAGKENVLVLPGRAADYKISIAQEPQGLGGGQKFGDVTIDRDGQRIHTQNIRQLVFLNGKQANPMDVVNGIADGRIKTVSTKSLHDAELAKLPKMDQCKYEALTSDALGAQFKAQHKQGNLQAEQKAAEQKAAKSCPAR